MESVIIISTIINTISALLEPIFNFSLNAIVAGHQAIIQRRKIIASQISELMNMKTNNNKDVIYAAFAMITIIAVLYITKSNKK